MLEKACADLTCQMHAVLLNMICGHHSVKFQKVFSFSQVCLAQQRQMCKYCPRSLRHIKLLYPCQQRETRMQPFSAI